MNQTPKQLAKNQIGANSALGCIVFSGKIKNQTRHIFPIIAGPPIVAWLLCIRQ